MSSELRADFSNDVSALREEIGLTPWKWAVRNRMQFSFFITIKSERPKQTLLLPKDFLGHELSDTNHLITVVGIENHITVLLHRVEYRKIVRRKTPKSP
jgi:hypothetical protein